MNIYFASERLRKTCAKKKEMVRRWGDQQASALAARLKDLESTSSLADMVGLPGKIHPLTADRSGQIALSLRGSLRLILVPDPELDLEPDADWKDITAVLIIDVTDYH